MENILEIKNLCKKYEGFSLSDVSFSIPRGYIMGFVGQNGSGKTTLIKLIQGFYEPLHGKILIGETPLHLINPHQWRGATGSVMQDGFIFSDTIARNIAVADEVIDMQRLQHAVHVANLEEFIASLPLGYNTKIGMEGNGISQGLHGVKLLLRTQEFEKFHANLVIVEVAVKVQNEALYRHTAIVVGHRGAHAHVGHGAAALAVEPYTGGVHAEGGHNDPGLHPQVDSGEAQGGAADLLAVAHPVAEGVGVAQKTVGPFHLALGDQGADIGGGDAHLRHVDHGHMRVLAELAVVRPRAGVDIELVVLEDVVPVAPAFESGEVVGAHDEAELFVAVLLAEVRQCEHRV